MAQKSIEIKKTTSFASSFLFIFKLFNDVF